MCSAGSPNSAKNALAAASSIASSACHVPVTVPPPQRPSILHSRPPVTKSATCHPVVPGYAGICHPSNLGVTCRQAERFSQPRDLVGLPAIIGANLSELIPALCAVIRSEEHT